MYVLEPGRTELAPMTLVVAGFDEWPEESTVIRQALDETLQGLGLWETATTANTIFPSKMWARSTDRHDLYQRYSRIVPALRRHGPNAYGTYFERLISWGKTNVGDDGFNQLERVLEAHQAGVRRRTGFQATLFDPRRDLTNQPLRGFPCLEHVAFGPDGQGGLEVTGFYTTQHIVGRAYGNLLGLGELGLFVAERFDLQLSKVTCVASVGQLGVTKASVSDLAKLVGEELG